MDIIWLYRPGETYYRAGHRSAMDGFLNILKPPGMSSYDVVHFVKKLLSKYDKRRKLKVGHLGTLDPLASGVLPLAIGRATRLIKKLPPAEKIYVAEVRLGVTSPTLDLEGKLERVCSLDRCIRLPDDRIENECRRFEGLQKQVPPMVSAVKVGGRRAYERFRSGEKFSLNPRKVTYQRVELLERMGADIRVWIKCGPGTYIRAFVRDLGVRLGVGAVLSFLVRLQSGPFHIDNSLTLEEFLSMIRLERVQDYLCSWEDLFSRESDEREDKLGGEVRL